MGNWLVGRFVVPARLNQLSVIQRNLPPETLLGTVKEQIEAGRPVLIHYDDSEIQHAAIIVGYLLNRNGEVKQFIVVQQSWGVKYRNKGTEPYPIAKLAREIRQAHVLETKSPLASGLL